MFHLTWQSLIAFARGATFIANDEAIPMGCRSLD
jgi:hypothetical protein